jgi:hypothetical protein
MVYSALGLPLTYALVAVTKLSPARQPVAPDPASTPPDDKTSQPNKTDEISANKQ